MLISEQPGRLMAIFIFGPFLVYSGRKYEDKLLILLGSLFILYEIFWVINYEPKTILLDFQESSTNQDIHKTHDATTTINV